MRQLEDKEAWLDESQSPEYVDEDEHLLSEAAVHQRLQRWSCVSSLRPFPEKARGPIMTGGSTSRAKEWTTDSAMGKPPLLTGRADMLLGF